MIEYQRQLLEKHKYAICEGLEDEPNFVQYSRSTQWLGLSVKCTIDIDDNDNPDNMTYRGMVSVFAEDDKRIIEWDSERKYKLMDVIVACERIERIVASLVKEFDKNKGE